MHFVNTYIATYPGSWGRWHNTTCIKKKKTVHYEQREHKSVVNTHWRRKWCLWHSQYHDKHRQTWSPTRNFTNGGELSSPQLKASHPPTCIYMVAALFFTLVYRYAWLETGMASPRFGIGSTRWAFLTFMYIRDSSISLPPSIYKTAHVHSQW